jgi:hypothetical protein
MPSYIWMKVSLKRRAAISPTRTYRREPFVGLKPIQQNDHPRLCLYPAFFRRSHRCERQGAGRLQVLNALKLKNASEGGKTERNEERAFKAQKNQPAITEPALQALHSLRKAWPLGLKENQK